MKRTNLFLFFGFLVIFLWTSPLAWGVEGVTQDTILVGATAPLTGPVTTVGVALRDSSQMYFDMINEAGGINGRKIKVIWEDDGCVPAKGVAAVRKLIERDKVFALFGGVCSNALIAAVPIIESAKIPYYTPICSATVLAVPVKHYIFRAGSIRTDIEGRLLSKLAVEYFKAEKIGLLTMSDEYGVQIRDSVKAYLNEKKMQPVAMETNNPGDVDYTAQLTRLKDANAEVVIMCMWQQDASVMIKQSKKMEFNPLWIGCNPTGEEPFQVMAGDAAIGTVHNWPLKYLLTDTQVPMMAKFRQEFKKRVGEKPGRPGCSDVFGYNGAMIFVEALKRAGKDLTRENLVKGFESIKNFNNFLAGTVTFSKTEHNGNFETSYVVLLPKQKRAILDVRFKP